MSLILSGSDGVSDIDGSASTPAIRGTDANTGIFFGADQVGVATNGLERVEFGNSETVFNDGGANVDFRVEGDTDASLFFIDASADRIGIGTTSPSNKLDITSGKIEFNGITVASGFSNNTIFINGSQNIADDATVSPALSNASLVYVSENNTGTGALFFATYASGTVVKLADPSGIFDVADTDGKVCVFKSAVTPTYTVKNRRGSTLSFTISCITVSD